MRKLMDEDSAVAEFANAINPCFNSAMTMREITEICLEFFRNVQIEGATDSILFDWGLGLPQQFEDSPNTFVDNRNMNMGSMQFAQRASFLRVAINRQILIEREDDDSKIACVMYFQKPPNWDDSLLTRGVFIEFQTLSESEEAIAEFLAIPFVSALFGRRPDYLCASAEVLG